MITVKCNKNEYAYDVHSLVKAFYPAEEVKVFEEGEKSLSSDAHLPELFMSFAEDTIEFKICTSLEAHENGMGDREEKAGRDKCSKGMDIGATSLCREQKVYTANLEGNEDRAAYKNVLKRLIYRALSEYTGKELPWGNLTGIRPTKIPYSFLEQGKSKEDILNYMKETYFCSDKKAKLAYDIALRERAILSPLHYENGYSLYIGIPFCPTTCLYCSFTSYSIASCRGKVDAYLSALEKEIDYVAENFKDKTMDSLYIGGGTPTTLEAHQLDRLLSYVAEKLDISHVLEYTVEAGRADSITRDKLEVLKKHGVTRISVNPQTMKEETLKLIGRRHTVEQVKEAFALAREIGFDNINMDLILGLPNETKEDVAETLRQVKELNPDSLTVHSLAIKRASKMSQWIMEQGIQCLNNTDETMEMSSATAEEMQMYPYYLYRQKNMSGNFENVGYARDGKFGIYNILIMEEMQDIVALGAGTVSKRVYSDSRIERCDNVKDVDLYIEKIEEMIERKRGLFGKVYKESIRVN